MPIGQKPNNPFDDAFDKLQAANGPLSGDILGGQVQPIGGTSGIADQTQASPDAEEKSPIGNTHPGFFSAAENNIHNPVLRNLAKIGDVAGRILVPGITANIPGTKFNEQQQENRELGIEGVKNKQAAEKAATEHTQAETAAIPATTAHTQAETEALQNAPDPDQLKTVQEGYARAIQDAVTNGTDPASDPHVQAWKQAAEALQKPVNQSTKEKLQAALVEAQNKGDAKTASKLQKQIKDIDPLGEQRTQISISNAAEHKSEHEEARTDKQKAAAEKEIKPYKDAIEEASVGHDLQKQGDAGNSEADNALMISFFKAMKGTSGSGIRFTQTEQNLIQGARPLLESLQVKGNKIFSSGEPLSSEQRKRMVDVMDLFAKHAQTKIDAASGSKSAGSSSNEGTHDLEYVPGQGLVPAKK